MITEFFLDSGFERNAEERNMDQNRQPNGDSKNVRVI
jgi:hypothetical protein